MKISAEQTNILKLAIQYINKLDSMGVDVSMSSFCYMNAQSISPGHLKLKNLQHHRKFSFKYFFIIFKHLFSIATLYNFKTIKKNNSQLKNDYEKLIVSWGQKKDFNEEGSFLDRKFKISSKENKNILWFLNYMDDEIPAKFDENVIIFYRDKKKFKYNFIYFLKIIFISIFKNRRSLFKVLHELSLQSQYAREVSEIINKIVLSNKFRSVIMPYESQPFQNKVFQEIKKNNKSIKTIGYNAVTQAFPSHNIYRSGAPDTLFVHGLSEINHLEKKLGWPKEKLKLIPSLNFKQEEESFFQSKIFLPFSIMSESILITEFENFLKNQKKESLNLFEIRNHPYMSKSKRHIKFIKSIKNIINKNSDKFSANSKNFTSIFFCETYAVIEALERGAEVIHICSDPIFQSYTKEFWPSINVTQISKYVFAYNLNKIGECIQLGRSEDVFNKYL
tara:strand:+ start:2050 stop:3393 length:1344 start_codon:yes stop_codon:yes gene_type:complete